jgi:hypothetical protein
MDMDFCRDEKRGFCQITTESRGKDFAGKCVIVQNETDIFGKKK